MKPRPCRGLQRCMAFFVGSPRLLSGTEAWPTSPANDGPTLSSGCPKREMEDARRRPIMQIELRPISAIRPYKNNPRINDQAVDAVAASIREFGFQQPIVIDEAGVIVVGHTRYKAALQLGLKKVPV